MSKYLKIIKYLNIPQKINKKEEGADLRPVVGGHRRPGGAVGPRARARGARGWERRGRLVAQAVAVEAGSGHGRRCPGVVEATTANSGRGRWRPGVAAAEATVACWRFETRQRREGKRSANSFEAQVYSSVN
jgi:hypothetical protein